MDSKQLVTIAVTAAISVVSREIVIWLVSLVKDTVRSPALREGLKRAIIKHQSAIKISFDSLGSAYGLWWFIHMPLDQRPVTHVEVALIAGSMVNMFYWAKKLLNDTGDAIEEWLDARDARQH